MKVTQFDRTNLRQINAEMEAAMKAVAKKYGLEVKLGNTGFSTRNASFKFELMTISDNGQAVTKEATDFNRYKNAKGIQANLGDTFEFEDGTYTIVGYKARSIYPVLAKCNEDNKTYKFPINLVNRQTNA
jgi:hypothetical protein